MFRIICNYGTNRTTFSRATALQWLAACGPDAKIVHRITGKILAHRVQG